MVESNVQPSRGHQIVESLLSKPTKKPDFSSFQQPEVLKRAQAFLPTFIMNTDKILSNPELKQASQMDVRISRTADFNPATQEKEFQQLQDDTTDQQLQQPGATIVNMDIGVGLFDVNNDDEQYKNQAASQSQLPPGMGYHQTSTEPILRMQAQSKKEKCPGNHSDDSDSSESSSGDEDRFMEFESSDDEEAMMDAQSMTTKSSGVDQKQQAADTNTTTQKRQPLIQVLASQDFEENKDADSNSQEMMATVGQKRRFRDR